MSDEIKLKPCPFCGGKTTVVVPSTYDTRYVRCADCFARGPVEATEEQAIASWEIRTDTLPTWQPIETAPKDGTFVILARLYELDGEPMSVVTFGHWTDGYGDGPDEMGMNSGWEDHHYSEFDPGRDFGNPSYMREPRQPTHWMPLPTPPKGDTHD